LLADAAVMIHCAGFEQDQQPGARRQHTCISAKQKADYVRGSPASAKLEAARAVGGGLGQQSRCLKVFGAALSSAQEGRR
jgi:hypothetical protein